MKIVALLASILFASHCFGEEITIGRPDSGNSLPFSSMIEYAYKQPIYQQAYNADAFGGNSINIKTISFASYSSPGGGGYASYEVSNSISLWIGIAQNPYDSLSNALNSNVDTYIEKKFSGSITAILQNDDGQDEFDYHIVLDTPFYYDPSMGDLIIQIVIHSGYALDPARENGGGVAFAAGQVDLGSV